MTLSGRVLGMHRHTLALVSAAAGSIESRLLERDLKEGAQRLNSMLTSVYNSISEGFIALDKDHRITHLNRAASNMLGLSAEPLIGKQVTDFVVSGEALAKQLDSLDFSKATEISFASPDGPRTFLCRVDPIQGIVPGRVSVVPGSNGKEAAGHHPFWPDRRFFRMSRRGALAERCLRPSGESDHGRLRSKPGRPQFSSSP